MKISTTAKLLLTALSGAAAATVTPPEPTQKMEPPGAPFYIMVSIFIGYMIHWVIAEERKQQDDEMPNPNEDNIRVLHAPRP